MTKEFKNSEICLILILKCDNEIQRVGTLPSEPLRIQFLVAYYSYSSGHQPWSVSPSILSVPCHSSLCWHITIYVLVLHRSKIPSYLPPSPNTNYPETLKKHFLLFTNWQIVDLTTMETWLTCKTTIRPLRIDYIIELMNINDIYCE